MDDLGYIFSCILCSRMLKRKNYTNENGMVKDGYSLYNINVVKHTGKVHVLVYLLNEN